MQEEVNEKTIALAKTTARLTGRILADMMRSYLNHRRQKNQQKQQKQPEQPKVKQGKTTLRKLQQRGDSLSTIEITDQNIKSF